MRLRSVQHAPGLPAHSSTVTVESFAIQGASQRMSVGIFYSLSSNRAPFFVLLTELPVVLSLPQIHTFFSVLNEIK